MVIVAGSRPASFAIRSSVARLSRSCSGVMRFGSQPSPQATTRCRTFFAPPPSSTGGGGFFNGLGEDLTRGGKKELPRGTGPPARPPPLLGPVQPPRLPPARVESAPPILG